MSEHYTDGLSKNIEENYDREVKQLYDVGLGQHIIEVVYTPKKTPDHANTNLPVVRFGFTFPKGSILTMAQGTLDKQVADIIAMLDNRCEKALQEVFTNPIYKPIHDEFKQQTLDEQTLRSMRIANEYWSARF